MMDVIVHIPAGILSDPAVEIRVYDRDDIPPPGEADVTADVRRPGGVWVPVDLFGGAVRLAA